MLSRKPTAPGDDPSTAGLSPTEGSPTEAEAQLPRSVMGRAIEPCGHRPTTGFFRDGCCNTDETDAGAHVVCAKMTDEFLRFSAARGNDLRTPAPHAGFPGLSPGDRWCLCAERWKEALAAGCAPPVLLGSTHERALEYISLEELSAHALDLN
jgi:uncharacterized protein (DUF2237 family)